MERDFLGLSLNHSVVIVKEEADDVFEESAFSKGLGIQWPLSNKVSALPHFMSLKVAQDEKMAKAVSDPVDSSGFMALSTANAFDTTKKCHYSEMEDIKMLLPPNQLISESMGSSFFKSHFAGAGQNCAGAGMKQQLFGGIPSFGSLTGTTEPWFNSKLSTAPTQLTIFYGGTVNVYDNISPEKAHAIMLLAGNGSIIAQPRAQVQVQVPASKLDGGDGFLGNQPTNAPPTFGLSSPLSVASHPVGQSVSGSTTTDEVVAVKPTGVPRTPVRNVNPPNIVTSQGPLAAANMIPSAVPQARKASLARFLEKRKERAMNSAPYNLKEIS